MKTTSKELNSFIKKRKIEIKKWTKEMIGKYEFPPKWKLIERIKESDTGCINYRFYSKNELINIFLDAMIVIDNHNAMVEEIFDYLSDLWVKDEHFFCIYYEDNKFVLKVEIDPINEKESDAEPEKLILQDSAI
jgi:DNA-directed RNA polymerase